jgi:sulfur carrier protein ThiS
MTRIRCLTFTFAILLVPRTQALAAPFTFVNIADSRGPFERFDELAQAVSDSGTVAFIGSQGGVAGSYVGDGTATNLVVADLSTPPGFQMADRFRINESGVVVARNLQVVPTGGQIHRVQLYEPAGSRPIFESGPGPTRLQQPEINARGDVAFGVHYGRIGEVYRSGLVRWSDGTSVTMVDETEGFEQVYGEALSEESHVSFLGSPDTGLDWTFYRTDGTTLTPIGGPFGQGGAGYTAINDFGDVAFWTRLDGGDEGIFVGDGGPLTTVAIADPTTPFYEFGSQIDINNQGRVAFAARLWDGIFGIYAGADPANDTVIQIGDLLFGQRVTGLGRPHLNDRGDMAFWYEVRDFNQPDGYRSGIVLAVNESFVPGDYNEDGTLNAADYVVWRNNLGNGTSLPNDDTTGVGLGDYDRWVSNFGATVGAGDTANANQIIPEPTAVWLALAVVAITSRLRIHRASCITRPWLPISRTR